MAKKKGNSKIVALDFDGVIHKYSKGWHDGTAYDEPMEGAFQALVKLINRGYTLTIFSSRDEDVIREWFKKWWVAVMQEEIPKEVTEMEYYKKPSALYVIDDRALRFTNWRDITNYIS